MLETNRTGFMPVKAAAALTGGRPLLFLLLNCLLVLPNAVRAGELEQFFYVPLPGAAITDLTSAPEFPEQPFVMTPVNWFHTGLEGITNASTAYGSWLRGYLEAPVTGDYTFYLSADDSAEFYLSTDHRAENKALLARVESKVSYGAYGRYPFQRSAPIWLERGRQYYFEVLHKSELGTDHVQVGWLRPDNVLERPIPLRYVQRFVPESYAGPGVLAPAAIAPVIAPSPAMGNLVSVVENQRVILAPHVSALPPVFYQWFENGAPLAGEILSSLDLGEVTEADNGRVFTLLAATPEGIELSDDWPLHVRNDATAPTIASAYTAGMTNGFLLTFSEPLDPATATNAANYAMNLGIGVTGVSLLYGTNLNTLVVRTTPFPPAGIPEVTVTGVRDRAQPPNEVAPDSPRVISLADGSITLRYYGGVFGAEPLGGTSILDMLGSGSWFGPRRFPDQPDLVTTRSEMGIPSNFADNYAAQLIGFLVPPVTGDYRFWIASDDQGILYLSSDADPANKRAIVVEPQWNGYRAYTTTTRRTMNNTGNSGFTHSHFPNIDPDLPANDSLNTVGPVHLEAGRRYYIEALMKEGGGGDSLDIAWQIPGSLPVVDGQAPIPGEFLAQWPGVTGGDAAVWVYGFHLLLNPIEGQRFNVEARATGQAPLRYQWFRNDVPIVDASEAALSFTLRMGDQGARYRVRVRNDFGEAWSEEHYVTSVGRDTLAPRITRAEADQHFDRVLLSWSEPVTAATATNLANYSIVRTQGGQPLTVQRAEVLGFSDDGYTNVLLRTAPIDPGVNYTVTTAGIEDLAQTPNKTWWWTPEHFTGWVLSRGFALYERWDASRFNGCAGCIPSVEARKYEPVVTSYLSSFESPQDVAEYYIGRISAFFVAPAAGRHDFYLASDENGELWLANQSGSTLPQTRIGFEPAWGNSRSWTGTSDGRRNNGDNNTVGDSLPILNFDAGEQRYLELVWKEGGGPDNGQATYSGPGEPVPANGSSSRLRGAVIATWGNPDAVTITIHNDLEDQTGPERGSLTFQLGHHAESWNPGEFVSTFVQWQTNGVDVAGANGSSFTLDLLSPVQNGLRVRCLVSAPGRTVSTGEALVSVVPDLTPPTVRLTGSAKSNEVWAIFDEPVHPNYATVVSFYAIDGLETRSVRMHPGDPRIAIITTSPQIPGTRYTATVGGVRDLAAAQNVLPATATTFTAWTLQPGWVRHEVWTNMAGVKVANLTNHPNFLQSADQVEFLPALDTPGSSGLNNGHRFSGWLTVTNTGDYLFAIAAADQAVFYLSTDENPANKQAVVAEPEWSGVRDWDSNDRRINSGGDDFFPQIDTLAVNRSQNTVGAIRLVAGEKYYLDTLHKEGGGGDYVAVTMWPADSPMPVNGTPGIAGALVWNYLNPDNAITITKQPEEIIAHTNRWVSFSISATPLDGPLLYQWWRDGQSLPGATSHRLELETSGPNHDGRVFRCRLIAPGVTNWSQPARLTVLDQPKLVIRPHTNDQVRLLWLHAYHPVPKLQWTPRLNPPQAWNDLPFENQTGGFFEWIIDPRAPGFGPEAYFRMVPAE